MTASLEIGTPRKAKPWAEAATKNGLCPARLKPLFETAGMPTNKDSGEQPIFNPLHEAGQPPAISRDDAQQFLQYLSGAPDMVFQFRVIDDKKLGRPARNMRGTLAELCDQLAAFNAAGFGVFVMINETTNGGTHTEDVIAPRASVTDLDGIRDGDSLVLRKQRLEYFNSVAPLSLTVESSPGKYHCYWFTWQMSLEQFTPTQKKLADILGGDPNICDLPRVMRVPGFLHQKGVPFLSRICYVAESVGRRRRADYVSPDVLERAIEKTRKKFALKPPRKPRKSQPDKGADLFDHLFPPTPENEQRIRDALDHVPAGPRDNWWKVGAALHALGWDTAREVWDSWSQKAPEKFDSKDQDKTWDGYRGRGDGLTYLTIFDMAYEHGWEPEFSAPAGNGQDDAAVSPAAGITLSDFVAYREQHNYIFKPTRAMWPASAVDDELPPVRRPGRKAIAASRWIATNQAVQQITWAPGEPELIEGRLTSDGGFIERKGVTVFNLYRAPAPAPGDATKAGRWSQHVRHVYPDAADHIIMFLAHRVQRPEEKINHALLLGGAQGIGKDTLLEPVKRAVGHWNFGEASPSDMFASFNKFQRSVILRVSEGRDLGDVDRFKLYDRMKTVIAAPPDVLKINEKNLREYYVPNCCSVIITSNYKTDGIYLPEDDRRHYVAYSELTKEDFTKAYWDGIWDWYDDGGYGHVAAYLAILDLSSFAPKAPPPKTAAFQAIVDAGRAPEIPEMMDALDKLDNPAAVTLEQLRDKAPSHSGYG
jgi:hypothetical protein